MCQKSASQWSQGFGGIWIGVRISYNPNNLKFSHQGNTKFQIPKNCLFILEMAGRYLDQWGGDEALWKCPRSIWTTPIFKVYLKALQQRDYQVLVELHYYTMRAALLLLSSGAEPTYWFLILFEGAFICIRFYADHLHCI